MGCWSELLLGLPLQRERLTISNYSRRPAGRLPRLKCLPRSSLSAIKSDAGSQCHRPQSSIALRIFLDISTILKNRTSIWSFKMDGAAFRRTRTTLLTKLSLPEQQRGAGSSGGKTTLLDFIQEDAAGASRPPQTEEVRPMRVSLMTLLSLGEAAHAKESAPADSFSADGASAGADREEEEVEEAAPAEERMLCCVCMVRRKGAAFIPCGHTFCRACSRELIAGRGNCPVCNEVIFDVLDIF